MGEPGKLPSESDAPRPLELDARTRLYVWLAGMMTASLLLADMLGVKLFDLFLFDPPLVDGFPFLDGHLRHTCGMLTFPLTFIITDLVNDYYGRKAARRLVWLSLAMGGMAFVFIWLSLEMPRWEFPGNVAPNAFEAVFQASQWMFIASLTAYTVGQMIDIWVFSWLKRLTRGEKIWLRATGSTVIAQVFDSLVVSWVAFGPRAFGEGATFTPGQVFNNAITGYVLKFVLALAVTPLIYAGHALVETWFGLEPLPPEPAKPAGE